MGKRELQLRFDIPAGEWLTANGRYHPLDKARRTKKLRQRAYGLAAARRLPRLGAYAVRVHVAYTHAGRADVPNVEPTVKALIDGLTDYGLSPDDDDRHVRHDGYRRDRRASSRPSKGHHIVTLQITPIGKE